MTIKENVGWFQISQHPLLNFLFVEAPLTLWQNLCFQVCDKLLPTRLSSSTSATVTTSTSFELPSSHARVTSIKFTKRQLGREGVTDKHSQWSDSDPIKIVFFFKRLATILNSWKWELHAVAHQIPNGTTTPTPAHPPPLPPNAQTKINFCSVPTFCGAGSASVKKVHSFWKSS